jgi:hypothetical protein
MPGTALRRSTDLPRHRSTPQRGLGLYLLLAAGHLPASGLALVVCAILVVGVGDVTLDERLRAPVLLGAALVVAGVALAARRRHRITLRRGIGLPACGKAVQRG